MHAGLGTHGTLVPRRFSCAPLGGWHGSALQAASEEGHEGVVKMLLEEGADVNALGGWHGSALQAASEEGHEGVVKMLLENGADVDAVKLKCVVNPAVLKLLIKAKRSHKSLSDDIPDDIPDDVSINIPDDISINISDDISVNILPWIFSPSFRVLALKYVSDSVPVFLLRWDDFGYAFLTRFHAFFRPRLRLTTFELDEENESSPQRLSYQTPSFAARIFQTTIRHLRTRAVEPVSNSSALITSTLYLWPFRQFLLLDMVFFNDSLPYHRQALDIAAPTSRLYPLLHPQSIDAIVYTR
ncbi:hypothetical protein GALMADRAFT_148708 [Galerina marginata CBS 339.88]|uniref:Uncharacterized protein n=1 Tax=Galerina marginata (strain CBS 339.88) TaxID=685588 RepID=A0A067S3Q1_GALM3|nr:hypothetical protein GALMADRAFT_148708 [Galerina marginata CBS 339.88]